MTIALFGYDKDHDIAVHGYAKGQVLIPLLSGIPFADTLPKPKVVKEQERIQDIIFLVVVNRLKLDSQFSLLINRIKEKAIFNIVINVLDLLKVYNVIINKFIIRNELLSVVFKPIKTKNIIIEKFNQITWNSKSGEME